MSSASSFVTTHVLDTASGEPAAGLLVRLEQVFGSGGQIAQARTGEDGRVTDLGPAQLAPGVYRLIFDTGEYFLGQGRPAFFPEVAVTFLLADGARHYHLPLLLSPFAYSTYRGS